METNINNKCKAHTSLGQSKKLAEILPIKSADGTWKRVVIAGCNLDVPEEQQYIHDDTPFTFFSGIGVPCWSLAALLDVMPNNEHITTTIARGGWKLDAMEYCDKWWCEYEDDDNINNFSISADNPIDACYEMILKLYEQNLL